MNRSLDPGSVNSTVLLSRPHFPKAPGDQSQELLQGFWQVRSVWPRFWLRVSTTIHSYHQNDALFTRLAQIQIQIRCIYIYVYTHRTVQQTIHSEKDTDKFGMELVQNTDRRRETF